MFCIHEDIRFCQREEGEKKRKVKCNLIRKKHPCILVLGIVGFSIDN